MKSFAAMTDAERRYEVGQILAEARECGHDLEAICHLIGLMFVRNNVPTPVSLMAWLNYPAAVHHSTTVH